MDWSSLRRSVTDDLVPGINPNRAVRPGEGWRDGSDPTYDLLFVEFDDQGRPFDPAAVDRVLAHLGAVAAAADPFVILFVHGWKHGAGASDDNVLSLKRVLHTAAHSERLRPTGVRPRRVVGLYVGWRGLTWHWLGLVQNATFWGRKEGALRVALGSVRELFARLRRLRLGVPASRLVLIGHSFGGLIVYSALAEYLIESVAEPDGALDLVAPFGDLTILVNPAFEAARYHPLHSAVARRRFVPGQPPVFVSVTAENDWATGLAFPLGRHLTPWTGPSIGPREHAANVDTMGHVPWMGTHDLTLAPDAMPAAATKLIDKPKLEDGERLAELEAEDASYRAFRNGQTGEDGALIPGWTRRYASGAVLHQGRPEPGPGETGLTPDCPFWVVRASPDVVDGHNGIFRFVFLDFLRQVLDDAIRARGG